MREEEIERIAYSQYCGWLYDVYLKIPSDLGFLTFDKATALAKRERVLRKREEKSLITKLLCNLGFIPCNYKHMYEHYDFALTLMNLMHKLRITEEDLILAETEAFYEKHFKKKLVAYQRYCFSYDIDDLTKKEHKICKAVEKKLFQKAIPPYGNFDFNEIFSVN